LGRTQQRGDRSQEIPKEWAQERKSDSSSASKDLEAPFQNETDEGHTGKVTNREEENRRAKKRVKLTPGTIKTEATAAKISTPSTRRRGEKAMTLKGKSTKKTKGGRG